MSPKKPKVVLIKDNVIKFITEAPDDKHLMTKVVLVFGIFKACGKEELTNMLTNHNNISPSITKSLSSM